MSRIRCIANNGDAGEAIGGGTAGDGIRGVAEGSRGGEEADQGGAVAGGRILVNGAQGHGFLGACRSVVDGGYGGGQGDGVSGVNRGTAIVG